MKTYNVIAIMPIKMENERLPGKNIMHLGNVPLLQYTLNNLKQIKCIEQVYVFCSQEEIIKYLPEGIMYLPRPAYLDLPQSNFNQIFDEIIARIDADIYIYAHATAPFVTVETMQECLGAVLSGRYDSAFCAVKIQDFLWKDNKPLNFEAENMPRSQDIAPIYRETSGIYVFKKTVYKKYHRRIGMTPFIKEVSYKEAVDINTREDFELAEKLL